MRNRDWFVGCFDREAGRYGFLNLLDTYLWKSEVKGRINNGQIRSISSLHTACRQLA